MAVMAAVTAVLLHQCAMDTVTDSSVFSTGKRRNGDYDCSYCITFKSVCCGFRD